jgi:dUTP pyrophosphatase
MKVKIKKLHSDAIIPKYAKPGDAGMDLTAISCEVTPNYVEYDTGLAFEIPEGYVGLIFARSSVSNKDLVLKNCVGVCDSSYRGSVKLRFHSTFFGMFSTNFRPNFYDPGERVGQIIILPYPQIELEEVEELSDSERGIGGFGSTN